MDWTAGRMQYAEYRRTMHWQDLENKIWARDLGQCRVCASCENLQLHHDCYRGYYKEKLADLRLLCGTCHEQFHREQKQLEQAQKDYKQRLLKRMGKQ